MSANGTAKSIYGALTSHEDGFILVRLHAEVGHGFRGAVVDQGSVGSVVDDWCRVAAKDGEEEVAFIGGEILRLGEDRWLE